MTIQRLNMDNSWFIEINGLKLLVDPWLAGEEVDYFRWFNTQWHRTPPIALSLLPEYHAVLVTQIYPDHYHKQTLLQLNPSRIVAPKSIQKSLKQLLPNAEVTGLCKQQATAVINGVEINKLPNTSSFGPSFNAFIIKSENESVLIAPHGYKIKSVSGEIGVDMKLIITPFNRYKLPFFLGGTLAPGIEGLRKLVTNLNPQFLVCTHDEDKHASGLVSKLASITRVSAAELNSEEIFKGKILEINDYNAFDI